MVIALTGIGIGCWLAKGVPESISSLVYALPRKWQWAWGCWLVLTAFSLAVPLIEALPELWQFLGFLTVCCLIGAAVTPIVQVETRGWHNALGVAAGVLSQLCVFVLCPWAGFLVWMLTAVVLVFGKAEWWKYRVFVAEVVSVLAVYASLLVISD